MRTASDLMTQDPVSLSIHHNIENLVDLLDSKRVDTVPIIDEFKKPIGMFTDFNAGRAYITHQSALRERNSVKATLTEYREYMTPAMTVPASASIREVVAALVKAPLHRIYVVHDRNGELVGVISPLDVLSALRGESSKTDKMVEDSDHTHKTMDELKDKVEKLEDSVELYRGMIEQSDYMMHSVDDSGNIIMANKLMRETLGYNEKGLVGKTIFELYPQNQHLYAKAGLNILKRGGAFTNANTAMLRKDGTLIFVSLASSALKNSKGEFLATITTSRVLESQALHSAVKETKYGDVD